MAVVIVAIGLAGVVGVLMVYWAIAGAIALSALWGWFITPTFGIPVPPLPIVSGLALLIHYATTSSQTPYEDHKPEWGAYLGSSLISPWLALLIGWLIHLWAGN